MKKFKIKYSGFVYILADDEEDARRRRDMGEEVYGEEEIDEVTEVYDFFVTD